MTKGIKKTKHRHQEEHIFKPTYCNLREKKKHRLRHLSGMGRFY